MSKLLQKISDPHFFGISEWEVIQEWSNGNGEMGLYTPIDDHPIFQEMIHGFILLNDGRIWHQQYSSYAPNAASIDLEIIAAFADAR